MKTFLTFLIVGLFLSLSSNSIYSQDLLDKIKDKVKDRVDQKTDEAIDKGLDKVEEEATKDDEGKEAENQQQEEKQTSGKADKMNKQETSEKSVQQDELKSYSKYDFIPGDTTIFFEDFSQDNVGDFPALWNTNSSGEVVSLNNFTGKWFQPGNEGVFLPEVKRTFGENFTMEFDLVYAPTTKSNLPDFGLDFFSANESSNIDAYVPGNGGCGFRIGAYALSVNDWKDQQYGEINNNKDNEFLLKNMNQKVRVSFAFQKQRVRFWLNEDKIFDLPRLLMPGIIIDKIRFSTIETDDQKPYFYITNLRVAVGQPDMRSKLLTDGKLVTNGILFDVNSDKIKPESYGTLKEISKILTDNPDVKVKIIGHTDNDGSDAANLDLSKRRAVSVKNALVKDFGIDASRIETDGKGESEPIADNKTAEGKANNRRVEFIKI